MTDHTGASATGRARPRTHLLRWAIPIVLIIAWFVVGSAGGPYFAKISEVSNNDQTSYLPGSSESAQVQKLEAKFTNSDEIPAIVVFNRATPLTSADLHFISGRITAMSSAAGVAKGTSPAIVSKDGKAAEVFVPVLNNSATATTVAALTRTLSHDRPSGLKAYVTGPAGQIGDLGNAFSGIDGILLLVAILAVLVILTVVYRSPLLPLFVLGTSMLALCASIFAVWWLAKDGIVALNGQVQGILFILVIGASTDYSLLYVSRYREALRDEKSRWEATMRAFRGAIEPIAASAATVIAGLLCLLLSELNSNRALGPVAAIGIVFAFLSSMTFLPALLFVAGRVAFWPRRPAYGSPHPQAAANSRGLWARLGRAVAAKPRLIWVTTALVLLVAAAGITQLRASGVSQSDIVEGYSAARTGQSVLGAHFPQGSGSPVLIVAKTGDLQDAADTALREKGINAVTVASTASPSGSLPVTTAGIQQQGNPQAAPKPTVVSGKVLLQATLTSDPNGSAAQTTVTALRHAYKGTGTLVGGVTATAIDTNAAGAHDRNLIIPIVLLVILLILMLLLRAILAPVLLILSVVLSFGATMGVSALVFNGIFRFPGADPAVPLYGFIFLVALGVDYNIFLMTRVREESKRLGTRAGVLRGLTMTGGVITSAGVVLAVTFAALAVIPVLFLSQLAFIVGFGVLLDTIVVRSLLIPALSYDIGRQIWWPSALARRRQPANIDA